MRPSFVRCRNDIPLKVRENIEIQQVLSKGERLFLFFPDYSYGSFSRIKTAITGYFFTNLRLFYFHQNKIRQNIFINDIRHVKVEKKEGRNGLTFQFVDGKIRHIFVEKKDSVLYLRQLLEAILYLRLEEIDELLLSDLELLKRDLMAILRENRNIDKITIDLAENLWQCKAEEGESLEQMMLRILEPKSKLLRIGSLWDRKINIRSVRTRLIYWSSRLGLKIPPGLDVEMQKKK